MLRISAWLLLVLIGHQIAAAADSERFISQWSQPAHNLAGRLIVAGQPAKGLAMTLELRNEGNALQGVTTHSPFTFDLTITDATGQTVQPTAERIDILSSPQAALVPRHSYLGFPVTLDDSHDGNTLDITTKLWNLKPGKYRLAGKYVAEPFSKTQWKGIAVEPWEGEIVLPALEVEIK